MAHHDQRALRLEVLRRWELWKSTERSPSCEQEIARFAAALDCDDLRKRSPDVTVMRLQVFEWVRRHENLQTGKVSPG